eukprot:jgi/Hompol1/4919/HPOL_001864-RA
MAGETVVELPIRMETHFQFDWDPQIHRDLQADSATLLLRLLLRLTMAATLNRVEADLGTSLDMEEMNENGWAIFDFDFDLRRALTEQEQEEEEEKGKEKRKGE